MFTFTSRSYRKPSDDPLRQKGKCVRKNGEAILFGCKNISLKFVSRNSCGKYSKNSHYPVYEKMSIEYIPSLRAQRYTYISLKQAFDHKQQYSKIDRKPVERYNVEPAGHNSECILWTFSRRKQGDDGGNLLNDCHNFLSRQLLAYFHNQTIA